MNAIDKSYLRIRQLRSGPTGCSAREFVIPDKVIPRQSDVRVKTTLGPRTSLGMNTKLPKKHYLAALLLHNEVNGCLGKAHDVHALRRTMRREFMDWKPKTMDNFFRKFAEHRNYFNLGSLYKNQPMPPLYAWCWNPNGYICHHIRKKEYLGFEYCKRLLTGAQFADPRFFTSDELSVLRNKADWHAPSIIEVQRIEAEIERPIYNSITWPTGYEKGKYPL